MIELILLIGLAMLAIEVSDSELAMIIKRFFGVDYERSLLIAGSKAKSFYKVLPKWVQFTIVIPFIILFVNVFLFIIRFLIKAINCPMCLSFHFGWLFAFLFLSKPLLIAFIYGAITILFVRIIDKYIIFK